MIYKKLDTEDITYIKKLVGDGSRVFIGGEIHDDYSHDELSGTVSFPEAVVLAVSTEEVSAIMCYASREHIPVTPRGSGTGLVGGAVAIKGGILLDLSHMNNILELDEENLTLTVEPGVMLMEISAYVEGRGFFYPPDPGEKSATARTRGE